MNQKTEIFVLEDGKVLQWASERPGRQQGTQAEAELPWPAPLYSSISLFSLSLSPPQPFVPPHSLPPQAYSIPQPAYLHRMAFWLFINTVFFFSIPILNSWARGLLVAPYLGAGVCSLGQQLWPWGGGGSILQMKLSGAHPCKIANGCIRSCAGLVTFSWAQFCDL